MSSGRKSLLAAFTQQQSRAQSLRTAVRRMEATPSSKPRPRKVGIAAAAPATTQHSFAGAQMPSSAAPSPASVVRGTSRSNSPAVIVGGEVPLAGAPPRSPVPPSPAPPSPAPPSPAPAAAALRMTSPGAAVTASPQLGISTTPPQPQAIEAPLAGAELQLPPPRPVARFDLMKWTTVVIGTLIVGLVIYKVYRFVKNRRAKTKNSSSSSSSGGAGAIKAAAPPAPPTLSVKQDESTLQQRIPNFVKASKPTKAAAPKLPPQSSPPAVRRSTSKAEASTVTAVGFNIPAGVMNGAARVQEAAPASLAPSAPLPLRASELQLPSATSSTAREEAAAETVQEKPEPQQPEVEAAAAAAPTAAAIEAREPMTTEAGRVDTELGGSPPGSGVTIEVEADEVESFLDAMQGPSSFAPSAGYPVP